MLEAMQKPINFLPRRFHTNIIRNMVDFHNTPLGFLHGKLDRFPDIIQIHPVHQLPGRSGEEEQQMGSQKRQRGGIYFNQRAYTQFPYTSIINEL